MRESRQPVIFIGHGSPMNALQDNDFTRTLRAWGENLRALYPPTAILCVSAHWWVKETAVTAMEEPRQLYDFSGFPPELFALRYPCKGDKSLAKRIASLDPSIRLDESWGIDHGTWTVLHHLFPNPSIPILQLSINKNLSNRAHWQLAEKLKPLRDEGVLMVGSGNIVHSFFGFPGPQDAPIHHLGLAFDQKIKTALLENKSETLISYEDLGDIAKFSAPTPDHYLPLLYVASQRHKNDALKFTFEGFQHASMSMRCFQMG